MADDGLDDGAGMDVGADGNRVGRAKNEVGQCESVHTNSQHTQPSISQGTGDNATFQSTVIVPSRIRNALVYKAKLAELAQRFDEMFTIMKEMIIQDPQKLSVDEHNMFEAAYKNVIGRRRASWRVVASIEHEGEPSRLTIIQGFKTKIEAEIVDICNDTLSIIGGSLIPNSASEEAMVVCYKMMGDCHRYLTEFETEETRRDSAGAALDAYNYASFIASSNLLPTHPIRLGLALNFSVFQYEILDSPDEACVIAKDAFDGAIAEFHSLNNQESCNETTILLILLRDCLKLWTTSDLVQSGMQI